MPATLIPQNFANFHKGAKQVQQDYDTRKNKIAPTELGSLQQQSTTSTNDKNTLRREILVTLVNMVAGQPALNNPKTTLVQKDINEFIFNHGGTQPNASEKREIEQNVDKQIAQMQVLLTGFVLLAYVDILHFESQGNFVTQNMYKLAKWSGMAGSELKEILRQLPEFEQYYKDNLFSNVQNLHDALEAVKGALVNPNFQETVSTKTNIKNLAATVPGWNKMIETYSSWLTEQHNAVVKKAPAAPAPVTLK